MASPSPALGGPSLVGYTVNFAIDPFGFIADLPADHGAEDAIGLGVVGMDELYVFVHPDHFKRAFVTDRDSIVKGGEFEATFDDIITAAEGDEWRRQCDKLNPFFRWDRVDDYTFVTRRQVECRLRTWPGAGTLSLKFEMKTVTLDTVFATILGRELDHNDGKRTQSAVDDLNGCFTPAPQVLPSWVSTSSRHWLDRVDRVLREEVRELVETADDESLTCRLADTFGTDTDHPTTVESLENQFVGMIFTDHRTIAPAFIYALYLPATYPETRERATAEVGRVVGNSPVTTETARELPALERVTRGTIRLYSPVHTLLRETAKPFPTSDRVIPTDTDIHLSITCIHRDERWYDDSLAFRPG